MTERNYEIYQTEARVYTKEKMKTIQLKEKEYKTPYMNYVLVYSDKDLKFIEQMFLQLNYESYVPKASIEDRIFDAYEEDVFSIDPTPFQMMAHKTEENDTFGKFIDLQSKSHNPLHCYFNVKDAGDQGSMPLFAPFIDIKMSKDENGIEQLEEDYKLAFYVKPEYNKGGDHHE